MSPRAAKHTLILLTTIKSQSKPSFIYIPPEVFYLLYSAIRYGITLLFLTMHNTKNKMEADMILDRLSKAVAP